MFMPGQDHIGTKVVQSLPERLHFFIVSMADTGTEARVMPVC
jgi:hypothetical protein